MPASPVRLYWSPTQRNAGVVAAGFQHVYEGLRFGFSASPQGAAELIAYRGPRDRAHMAVRNGAPVGAIGADARVAAAAEDWWHHVDGLPAAQRTPAIVTAEALIAAEAYGCGEIVAESVLGMVPVGLHASVAALVGAAEESYYDYFLRKSKEAYAYLVASGKSLWNMIPSPITAASWSELWARSPSAWKDEAARWWSANGAAVQQNPKTAQEQTARYLAKLDKMKTRELPRMKEYRDQGLITDAQYQQAVKKYEDLAAGVYANARPATPEEVASGKVVQGIASGELITLTLIVVGLAVSVVAISYAVTKTAEAEVSLKGIEAANEQATMKQATILKALEGRASPEEAMRLANAIDTRNVATTDDGKGGDWGWWLAGGLAVVAGIGYYLYQNPAARAKVGEYATRSRKAIGRRLAAD